MPDDEVERHLRRTSGPTSSATRPTGHRGWPSRRRPGPTPSTDLLGALQGLVGAPAGLGADAATGRGRDRAPPLGRRRRPRRLPRRRGAGRTPASPSPSPSTCPARCVETVVAGRAVDWSNALFLSCRFRAWRAGEFNEFVYNFFKSLSERAHRAGRGRGPVPAGSAAGGRGDRARRLRDGAVVPPPPGRPVPSSATSATAC